MYILRLISGAYPGFQVRGADLKQLRREEGGAIIVGVFRVKNHEFTPTNYIFSNFMGGRGHRVGPPGSVPGASIQKLINIDRRKFGIIHNEVIDRFIWTIEVCHI
jgi:hypothetical protein